MHWRHQLTVVWRLMAKLLTDSFGAVFNSFASSAESIQSHDCKLRSFACTCTRTVHVHTRTYVPQVRQSCFMLSIAGCEFY